MSMELAYSSWINVKQALQLIGEHPLCRENMERFLISYANGMSDIDSINNLLLDECQRKNIKCDMEMILNIHMILNQKHKLPKRLPFECLRLVSSERTKMLLKCHKATRYDILKSLLRYEACLPGGQQWSIPTSIYKMLVEDFGVTVEAFASPFNSQILRFGHKYCSLFEEYDAIFGSIGSFFKYVPRPGTVICANPPFILDIVASTIDLCLKHVNAIPDLCYILVLPNWTDAEYYNKLRDSEYTKYFTVMERGKFVFTCKQKSKELVCNVLFAVIGKCDNPKDFDRILDRWASIGKSSIQ